MHHFQGIKVLSFLKCRDVLQFAYGPFWVSLVQRVIYIWILDVQWQWLTNFLMAIIYKSIKLVFTAFSHLFHRFRYRVIIIRKNYSNNQLSDSNCLRHWYLKLTRGSQWCTPVESKSIKVDWACFAKGSKLSWF